MKDLQKIKEFFSKPLEEVKKDEYGNHLEPQFKKGDKVTYLGNPGEITGVNKEMTGTYTYNVSYDKGNGKTKATNISNKNGTDIKLTEIKSVKEVISTPMDAIEFLNSNKDEIVKLADQYKGDVVSMQKAIDAFLAPHIEGASDFIVNKLKSAIGSAIAKRNIAADPKLSTAYDTLKNVKAVVKEETDIDTIKKKLDALGVKYEMSKTDKVRPFKVIYKPVNKSDEFYDKFNDIVDLANLKGVVKSSMNEVSSTEKFLRKLGWAGEDWTPQEFASQIKKLPDNTLISWAKSNKGIGKGIPNTPLAFQQKLVKIEMDKRGLSLDEAKEEDKVDTITMDIPLFLRMLEYSKEDAKKDLDLHDVTEKANKLGKEKGILSMEDYDAIVSAAEEIDEAELTEANVPSNIRDFAKRKGVSSLVNKVAGWAEKVGARIAGGTAVGKNYSTLVLDLDYKQQGEIRIDTDEETVTLYDEPVSNFNQFERVYRYGPVFEKKDLNERIAEALDKINEELCPAGKAYIKRRQAAGEKSSAYLSGRAVKVCKGQMSGRAKKK